MKITKCMGRYIDFVAFDRGIREDSFAEDSFLNRDLITSSASCYPCGSRMTITKCMSRYIDFVAFDRRIGEESFAGDRFLLGLFHRQSNSEMWRGR